MSNSKNKIHFIALLLLSYLAIINCIIELPLAYKNLKGVSKKNIIKAKKSYSKPSKYLRFGEAISYEEGPLTFNDNYFLLTTVKIGSGGEKYNLVLETGSNNLWVVSRRVSRTSAIGVKQYYSSSASSSSNNTEEPFQINYGSSGSVTGTYYIDQFKYMNNKIFNMKFGVANRITTTNSYGNADGVIGLGHYYEDEQMSFMHMLKKYNVTDSKIFSIKLFNVTDIEEEEEIGKLYIGKHEDFSSKKSVTCPLIKVNNATDIFWNFQLNGIGFKKSSKEINSSRSFNVSLQTTSNILILPYDYLSDIEKNLTDVNCSSYQESRRSSVYQLRCSADNGTLPDFRLNINGTILTIPARYVFQLNVIHYYSSIYFTKSEELYTIGLPFLYAYHTLFDSDNGKLHFYPNLEEIDDGKENDGKDKDGKDKDGKDKDGKGKDGKENDGKENDGKGDETGKNGKKGNSNLALIISCIVGGVLLLLALGILIYCCCIKSKKGEKDDLENTEPIISSNENNENNENNQDNENNEDN